MNKTISINIGGFNFNIDEDAYEKLRFYLDSIRKNYKVPEEEEIMSDIEAGIAEKFTAMVSGQKQSISVAQVDEIIKIMGTVEEITEEDADADNMDEAKETETNSKETSKRLYRDSDDVVIAGVASGLAAYFGIDPVFIRLLFVLTLFADGIGLLVYLIFWLIMPKAQTSTQKLSMRGKPINISEISQAVKEKSKMIGNESVEAVKRLRQSSAWYRILNFPIRIIEITFSFIKRLFRIFWPITAVFFGIIFIAGAFAAIIGFSIVLGYALLNINSPYIMSDLPLADLASNPLYYAFAISAYLVALIPTILFLFFGTTLFLRKNTFKPAMLGILAGMWMLAVVISATVAGNLVPQFKARIDEINQAETITKNFDYKDFQKIYLSGNLDIKIKNGDKYSIALTGRNKDLDRLSFNIEDGQLQIMEKDQPDDGKLCIFCYDEEITGVITLPKLESFVGIRDSEADISGFKENIYLSIGEVNSTKMSLNGQNIKMQLAGAGSHLELYGVASSVDATMMGVSRLTISGLNANYINLEMGASSRATMSGEADNLKAKIHGNSKLMAVEMAAKVIEIKATDYSRAEVWPIDKLTAFSHDESTIKYKNSEAEVEKNISGNGDIDIAENEDLSLEIPRSIYIQTDTDRYSPAMSSIRGIGLLPVDEEGDARTYYIWRADQGYFVKNWEQPEKTDEIKIYFPEEKVYWSYLSDDAMPLGDQSFNIYLEGRDKDTDEVIDSDYVQLRIDKQGMVTLD